MLRYPWLAPQVHRPETASKQEEAFLLNPEPAIQPYGTVAWMDLLLVVTGS